MEIIEQRVEADYSSLGMFCQKELLKNTSHKIFRKQIIMQDVGMNLNIFTSHSSRLVPSF